MESVTASVDENGSIPLAAMPVNWNRRMWAELDLFKGSRSETLAVLFLEPLVGRPELGSGCLVSKGNSTSYSLCLDSGKVEKFLDLSIDQVVENNPLKSLFLERNRRDIVTGLVEDFHPGEESRSI